MKKIKLLGVVAMILFMLVACNGEYENRGSESTGVLLELPSTEIEAGTVENEKIENDRREQTPYHLIWGSGTDVTLIESSTGQAVGTFEVAEGEWIWEILNFNHGYFGLLVGDATAEGFIVEQADDERLRYLILDQELNVVEDLLLTNEDLQDSLVRFSSHVVYESGQLFVYYMTDPMMIAWGNEEYQSIRRYDVHTGVTETLTQIRSEPLHLPKVKRISDDLIAFTGAPQYASEGELRYGFVDLTTGEMTDWEERSFPINSYDQLQMIGSTLLIREQLAPPTMGEWGMPMSVLRGEVIIFNAATGENRVISLEGLESYWATLSLDGRYVVTVDSSLSYLRKYEITTGSLVVEVAIQLGGDQVTKIISLPDHQYGIYALTLTPDGEHGDTHFQLVILP